MDKTQIKLAQKYLKFFQTAPQDPENCRDHFKDFPYDEDNDRHHPMLDLVRDCAYEIHYAYCFDGEIDIKYELVRGKRTLLDFIAGDYYNTELYLYAVYLRKEHDNIVEGMSLTVRHQNGKTTCEISYEELRKEIEKIISHLNPNQTDYWYLANLSQKLPTKLSQGFKLDQSLISDRLY